MVKLTGAHSKGSPSLFQLLHRSLNTAAHAPPFCMLLVTSGLSTIRAYGLSGFILSANAAGSEIPSEVANGSAYMEKNKEFDAGSSTCPTSFGSKRLVSPDGAGRPFSW